MLHFLNLYQHVHNGKNAEVRQQFWEELDHTLHKISSRHHLTLLGDFNTSLLRRTTAVGLSSFRTDDGRTEGPKHPDSLSHWINC